MPVYEYQGQHYELADGLSNEQALAKIKGHLGQGTSDKQKQIDQMFADVEQKGKNWSENLRGVAETGLSLLTGGAAMAAAPIVAGLSQLGGSPEGKVGVEQAMERMTFEPRTEQGKEITGRVGEAISRYIVPGAVAAQGLNLQAAGPIGQVFDLGAKLVGAGGKSLAARLTRAGKVAPKEVVKAAPEAVKPVDAAIAELSGKTETPTAPASDIAFWKERAAQMEKQAQEAQAAEGQRPIIVGPEGVEMPGMRSAEEAMAAFDRQVRRAEREVPKEGTETLQVDRQGQVFRPERAEDAATTELARKMQALQEADRLREEQASAMAERAGKQTQEEMFGAPEFFDLEHAGEMPAREVPPPLTEQRGLFEPYTNMHRPYTEMFAKEGETVRPFSFNEFKEILNKLNEEPGTAFKMPEDLKKAYEDYLAHPEHGQRDLFGAEQVTEVPSHKTFGEFSPQQKGALTRKVKGAETISDAMLERMKRERLFGDQQLRAGFTAEDMSLSTLKHLFGGGKGPLENIPGVGDRLKDIGYARIETPELAIKLATETPDVTQNAVQKGINFLTKGGIYLKAKLKNPVVHFTVDRFLKAEGVAKAEISQKLHGDYLNALRELSTEEYNTAFKLLNAADLNQRPLTPEFLQKHGFSEKLQNFIQVHQDMMTDALSKINAAREAAGKKPISARVAYSAMNMTGDFRKVAYKIVDGEKQVVGVIGSDTKTAGKKSLAALEKAMLEKDPTLEFGPLQDMTKTSKSTKGTPHEAFLDVLDTLGEDNPHIKEFLDVLKEVAKDDPNNYMGMQKHTMQKKGIWGMEGRKPWLTAEENAKAFFENQVKYMEGAYNWGELSQAARDVNEVLRNEQVIEKQPNAIGLSEQYMQNALGLNPSRVGKAVTDLTNSLFGAFGIGPSIPKTAMEYTRLAANTSLLSLNPIFLGIQLLQMPQVLPGITALLRGRGVAPKSTMFTLGFDHATKATITLGKYVMGKELTALERQALNYAEKNHIYATDLVEHTTQTQKGGAYYASKITQTPAAKIEAGTRAQVFMTMVHMMDEAGLKPKDGLFEQAQRFTDMAMNHYGALEKPKMYNALGPIGSMAYNLRSYGHNEISRWSLYAREIANSGNPAPLLTQMATTIAFAGVMGLPFFSQWEAIYDFITKKLGKPRSLALDVMSASEAVGKELGTGAYALSNGLPTLMGVDLSKRTGLGDVLPSSASEAAFAGGSKLGQMAKAGYQFATKPSEETAKALAINVAPPAMQGPMDVAWYQKGDIAYSKDPEKLRPVAKRTDRDVLLKKIGLTGINESVQKQKVYQQRELDTAYQEYRSSAMNTIAQDLFRNRKPDQKTLDKYFVTGQGDPATFETDLTRMATELNMSPQEYLLIRQAASTRIPQLRSMQRRMQ